MSSMTILSTPFCTQYCFVARIVSRDLPIEAIGNHDFNVANVTVSLTGNQVEACEIIRNCTPSMCMD